MKQIKFIILFIILIILCLFSYLYVNSESFIQDNTTSTISNNIFNNTELINIANYANNKYISVPNDVSLTNFYKLDFDSNYNIAPFITIPSNTIPSNTIPITTNIK